MKTVKFSHVIVGNLFICNHCVMRKIVMGSRKRYGTDEWDANAIHIDPEWPVRISPDREVELIETKEESENNER